MALQIQTNYALIIYIRKIDCFKFGGGWRNARNQVTAYDIHD